MSIRSTRSEHDVCFFNGWDKLTTRSQGAGTNIAYYHPLVLPDRDAERIGLKMPKEQCFAGVQIEVTPRLCGSRTSPPRSDFHLNVANNTEHGTNTQYDVMSYRRAEATTYAVYENNDTSRAEETTSVDVFSCNEIYGIW